jgi:hypothetical protein
MKNINEEGGTNSSHSVKKITKNEYLVGVTNDIKQNHSEIRQSAKS